MRSTVPPLLFMWRRRHICRRFAHHGSRPPIATKVELSFAAGADPVAPQRTAARTANSAHCLPSESARRGQQSGLVHCSTHASSSKCTENVRMALRPHGALRPQLPAGHFQNANSMMLFAVAHTWPSRLNQALERSDVRPARNSSVGTPTNHVARAQPAGIRPQPRHAAMPVSVSSVTRYLVRDASWQSSSLRRGTRIPTYAHGAFRLRVLHLPEPCKEPSRCAIYRSSPRRS